ncbi:Transcriptional regulator [Lachnellula hyalina]|uniref:Transcriptional regulator n=1 Tax=Lachnellula hyalina TaxID=1316788 RepID=A0A8H8R536_9HELO|nr:Transcriptional regulator [Lachnellula hyalina]TVY27660.1 Transcriptional regulator [Lachnellula hyalina]
MGVFTSKPARPATVPTDTIIPLHSKDDTKSLRPFVLDFTLCFDDVLDAEKLRSSLERLMEIGDWRKLGARLRLNDAGKLEYHIPASFNAQRPAFRYSHMEYETSISEHPLASKLPRPTSRPAVLNRTDEFQSLLRRQGGPTKLEDYLDSDDGQLSLHIVCFSDATLVTLTWPHTFLDAMGRRALYDAWLCVLNGREADVLPLHGFSSDPLAGLGTQPTEPYALEKHQITGFAFFLFALRYAFELIWYPAEEMRIICLPAPHLNAMKATALSELCASSPDTDTDTDTDTKPFLSDGDVISAWLARLALSPTLPQSSPRTVLIMNAFGLRGVLANDLLPPRKAYIANASNSVHALLPAHEILTRPLSYTACAVRHSIAQQGTRAQIEALAAIERATYASSGRSPVFGDRSMKLVVVSNWTKTKLFELDFSAAVVKAGVEVGLGRRHGVGRPRYVHSCPYSNGVPIRNAFPVFGRDAQGNYWMSGMLRAETWRSIEEGFKREL